MKNVTLPFVPLPLAAGSPLSAFKLLGSQSPVALPEQAQQRALTGASGVLAPVGFLSAKLLAQLAVVCSPILLLGTFIASQAENCIHSSEIAAGPNSSLAWPRSYYL